MVDRVQHTGCHLAFSRYVCGGDRRGPIVDYLGRRTALVVTTAGAALSSGLAARLRPIYLIVVRSLSGFGYSEQAVNTTYLSEIYGAGRRG